MVAMEARPQPSFDIATLLSHSNEAAIHASLPDSYLRHQHDALNGMVDVRVGRANIAIPARQFSAERHQTMPSIRSEKVFVATADATKGSRGERGGEAAKISRMDKRSAGDGSNWLRGTADEEQVDQAMQHLEQRGLADKTAEYAEKLSIAAQNAKDESDFKQQATSIAADTFSGVDLGNEILDIALGTLVLAPQIAIAASKMKLRNKVMLYTIEAALFACTTPPPRATAELPTPMVSTAEATTAVATSTSGPNQELTAVPPTPVPEKPSTPEALTYPTSLEASQVVTPGFYTYAGQEGRNNMNGVLRAYYDRYFAEMNRNGLVQNITTENPYGDFDQHWEARYYRTDAGNWVFAMHKIGSDEFMTPTDQNGVPFPDLKLPYGMVYTADGTLVDDGLDDFGMKSFHADGIGFTGAWPYFVKVNDAQTPDAWINLAQNGAEQQILGSAVSVPSETPAPTEVVSQLSVDLTKAPSAWDMAKVPPDVQVFIADPVHAPEGARTAADQFVTQQLRIMLKEANVANAETLQDYDLLKAVKEYAKNHNIHELTLPTSLIKLVVTDKSNLVPGHTQAGMDANKLSSVFGVEAFVSNMGLDNILEYSRVNFKNVNVFGEQIARENIDVNHDGKPDDNPAFSMIRLGNGVSGNVVLLVNLFGADPSVEQGALVEMLDAAGAPHYFMVNLAYSPIKAAPEDLVLISQGGSNLVKSNHTEITWHPTLKLKDYNTFTGNHPLTKQEMIDFLTQTGNQAHVNIRTGESGDGLSSASNLWQNGIGLGLEISFELPGQ
jgi:hypothetical protein